MHLSCCIEKHEPREEGPNERWKELEFRGQRADRNLTRQLSCQSAPDADERDGRERGRAELFKMLRRCWANISLSLDEDKHLRVEGDTGMLKQV